MTRTDAADVVARIEAEFGGECVRLGVGEAHNCPDGGLKRPAWCESCRLRAVLSEPTP